MLVGFPPFNDDTVEAIFSNILERRVVWPDDDQKLSDEVVDLINRLLEIDPEKRMSWNELIVHPYFEGINWDILLEMTPPFVPTLDDPNDTSYFNNRNLTDVFIEDEEFDYDSDPDTDLNNSNEGNAPLNSLNITQLNTVATSTSQPIPTQSQKPEELGLGVGRLIEADDIVHIDCLAAFDNNLETIEDFDSDCQRDLSSSATTVIDAKKSEDVLSHFGSPSQLSSTPQAFRTFSFTNMNALAAANRREADVKVVVDFDSDERSNRILLL